MTLKTFKKIDKKGREETWEWQETPELLKALEVLNESSKLATSLKEGAENSSETSQTEAT